MEHSARVPDISVALPQFEAPPQLARCGGHVDTRIVHRYCRHIVRPLNGNKYHVLRTNHLVRPDKLHAIVAIFV